MFGSVSEETPMSWNKQDLWWYVAKLFANQRTSFTLLSAWRCSWRMERLGRNVGRGAPPNLTVPLNLTVLYQRRGLQWWKVSTLLQWEVPTLLQCLGVTTSSSSADRDCPPHSESQTFQGQQWRFPILPKFQIFNCPVSNMILFKLSMMSCDSLTGNHSGYYNPQSWWLCSTQTGESSSSKHL